ncbi:MAG: SDR family oxidoreductase [Solirubrobacterales bacterium]
MELQGKVALVTGASGGIGAAVARRLHGSGASVGLLSRRGDDLGLERGLGVTCDVRDRIAVAAAADAVVERFGRLDLVVANAGVGAYGSFLELDPEQLEAMIDVNLKGTLYTAAATLPRLIAAGEGDFVALASVAGLRAFPGEAVYNASKFGQVGFTRALDHELRERGVRATCICPGGVNTGFAIGTGRTEGRLRARGNADRRRGRRRGPVHGHAPQAHADPDHQLPPDDRGVLGLSAARSAPTRPAGRAWKSGRAR